MHIVKTQERHRLNAKRHEDAVLFVLMMCMHNIDVTPGPLLMFGRCQPFSIVQRGGVSVYRQNAVCVGVRTILGGYSH